MRRSVLALGGRVRGGVAGLLHLGVGQVAFAGRPRRHSAARSSALPGDDAAPFGRSREERQPAHRPPGCGDDAERLRGRPLTSTARRPMWLVISFVRPRDRGRGRPRHRLRCPTIRHATADRGCHGRWGSGWSWPSSHRSSWRRASRMWPPRITVSRGCGVSQSPGRDSIGSRRASGRRRRRSGAPLEACRVRAGRARWRLGCRAGAWPVACSGGVVERVVFHVGRTRFLGRSSTTRVQLRVVDSSVSFAPVSKHDAGCHGWRSTTRSRRVVDPRTVTDASLNDVVETGRAESHRAQPLRLVAVRRNRVSWNERWSGSPAARAADGVGRRYLVSAAFRAARRVPTRDRG